MIKEVLGINIEQKEGERLSLGTIRSLHSQLKSQDIALQKEVIIDREVLLDMVEQLTILRYCNPDAVLHMWSVMNEHLKIKEEKEALDLKAEREGDNVTVRIDEVSGGGG